MSGPWVWPRRRLPVRLVTTCLLSTALGAQSGARRPITFHDFSALRGVSDPQLSPGGGSVLYAVRSTDVDANRRSTITYLLAIAGGAPRAFPDDTTHATEARWSPDGTRVAYVAGGQLWIANAAGGERHRLTSLSQGASGPVWAPTGDRIAFVSAVYPACTTDACTAQRADSAEKSKVKAHIADQLLFRHWNAWDGGTRSHLFVVAADGSGLRDLTLGKRYDVPPGPFGGSEGYAFSPDGRELAYTAKDQGRADAWTTDVNVYTVPVGGGDATVITRANLGADQNPVYSPDGKWIVYASQRRPGFESDRWRLMRYDRAMHAARELLPSWDRNANGYAFTAGGGAMIISTDDRGRDKVFRVTLDANGAASAPAVLVGEHNETAPSLSRDGRTMAWVHESANQPPEVWAASIDGGHTANARALSHVNDALVGQLDMHPAEDFWFVGAGGDSVQGFVLRPPGWTAGRKYPLILLVHGGPQGAWLDSWSTRWNYQMWAATGAALVIVNPRGSTGYGQRFVDGVSRDWGGKPYEDLMKGLDAALRRDPWLDSTRMAAAGGSYGGYMVNWMAGHTTRFKALISHAGPFNLENMSSATEEQWFTDWEFGGPWFNDAAMREQFRKFSPHLYAKHFRTPTLVLNGELDYRVPYTEGLSMFTALQRQGVPSRLVVFPDEGHWILKPQNARLWWHEVQGWAEKYLQPKPVS